MLNGSVKIKCALPGKTPGKGVPQMEIPACSPAIISE
jgi:hypothetical protein